MLESSLCFEIFYTRIEAIKFMTTIFWLFYPFRTETDVKSDNSYTKNPAPRNVTGTANRNRSIIEPYCKLVDEALLRYNSGVINNDKRTEENLFSNNDDLDDDMNRSSITNFKILRRSQWNYSVFECQTKTNFWSCFDMGK